MRVDFLPRSLSGFSVVGLLAAFVIITVFAGAPSIGMYLFVGGVVYLAYLVVRRSHDRLKYGKQRGGK